MTVFKIDHTVAWCLSEDRNEFIDAMKISGRMYSWYSGEDIESTVENFAVANPRATLGQLMDWTKRTHIARLTAFKQGGKFGDFKIAAATITNADPKRNMEGPRVDVIKDAIPARPKARTDLKKVAEPGQEADLDAADEAALADEFDAGPNLGDLRNLPATDPDAGKPDPLDPPYVGEGKGQGGVQSPADKYAQGGAAGQSGSQSPLAAKLAEMNKKP